MGSFKMSAGGALSSDYLYGLYGALYKMANIFINKIANFSKSDIKKIYDDLEERDLHVLETVNRSLKPEIPVYFETAGMSERDQVRALMLDYLVGPVKGNIVIVGAAPGTGKSYLCQLIAKWLLGIRHDYPAKSATPRKFSRAYYIACAERLTDAQDAKMAILNSAVPTYLEYVTSSADEPEKACGRIESILAHATKSMLEGEDVLVMMDSVSRAALLKNLVASGSLGAGGLKSDTYSWIQERVLGSARYYGPGTTPDKGCLTFIGTFPTQEKLYTKDGVEIKTPNPDEWQRIYNTCVGYSSAQILVDNYSKGFRFESDGEIILSVNGSGENTYNRYGWTENMAQERKGMNSIAALKMAHQWALQNLHRLKM